MNQKTALSEKSNDYTPLEKAYRTLNNTDLLDPFASPPVCTSSKTMTATVIIPARNVKTSILSCLVSIEQSSFNIKYQNKLQVVVVDDGSDDGTWECIKKNRFALNLVVLKQKHSGQAQALNTGIAATDNDIIISCDADMILSHYSIEHFIRRHEQFPNVLLTGFRSDISDHDPLVNPQHIRHHGTHRYSTIACDERIEFSAPGYPNNMCLISNHFKNLGHLRGLWMRKNNDPWLLSDLVFGALFSLPKSTYNKIGGYDERLIGYGCTDGYLASKAISVGTFVIPVYAASGLHISHPSRTENKQRDYKNNRRLFYSFLESSRINEYPNWLAHAKERIIDSYMPKPRSIDTKKLNTNESKPNYYEVDTLLALGKFNEALNLLSNNADNKTADVALKLGKSFFGLGMYSQAIDNFKIAVSDIPEAAVTTARAQAALHQFQHAHKTLIKFAEENPKSDQLSFWGKQPALYHTTQGEHFSHQGFYDTAIHCFENALICEPGNKIALDYIKKPDPLRSQ